MSDSRTLADAGDQPGAGLSVERQPGIPRWVKVSATVAAVLLILVVVMMLVGGGPGAHGPSRH